MTIYDVLHETIKIHFYDCSSEITFVSREICAKMPQKLNYQ